MGNWFSKHAQQSRLLTNMPLTTDMTSEGGPHSEGHGGKPGHEHAMDVKNETGEQRFARANKKIETLKRNPPKSNNKTISMGMGTSFSSSNVLPKNSSMGIGTSYTSLNK